MNKQLIRIFTILLFSLFPLSFASASVVIDPTTGWDGYFEWNDGLGQIDSINYTSDTDWSLTLASDGIMTLASAWDDFLPGDEFSLILDGTDIGWTSTHIDTDSYFHGLYEDLFLTAGTHFLTLDVTALTPNFISGGAYVDFSSVAPVPEPSTILLLGGGLLGLGWYGRKRKK